MILTDREIKTAIQHDIIRVNPLPDDDAFSSTSLDLTLDAHLNEFDAGAQGGVIKTVDPMDKEFDPEETLKQLTTPQQIHLTNGYHLRPGHLVLGWTEQYIELPTHSPVAARVEGKSSRARFGLGVHITAPTIHAGFKGRVRLEMMNHSSVPIILRQGMPICQLIFEQTLGTADKGYQGVFWGQTVDANRCEQPAQSLYILTWSAAGTSRTHTYPTAYAKERCRSTAPVLVISAIIRFFAV